MVNLPIAFVGSEDFLKLGGTTYFKLPSNINDQTTPFIVIPSVIPTEDVQLLREIKQIDPDIFKMEIAPQPLNRAERRKFKKGNRTFEDDRKQKSKYIP